MILFVEEDCPSSLYLRILAKYLHLEKSFGLKIVVVDEALKHSGNNCLRPFSANLAKVSRLLLFDDVNMRLICI